MIKYIPPKTNRAGFIVSLLLFTIAAVCFGFSAAGLGYRLVMQLICFCCLIIGIQITTRYVLCSYEYILNMPDTDVEDISGSIEFVKIQGQKRTTACSLSVSTAIGLIPRIDEAEIVKNYGKIERKLNFCNNMFPLNPYYYVFEFNGKKSILVFEPDEYFLEAMQSLISN